VETPFCQLFDATLWVPNRCNCEGWCLYIFFINTCA
jgi:hypothetical protein